MEGFYRLRAKDLETRLDCQKCGASDSPLLTSGSAEARTLIIAIRRPAELAHLGVFGRWLHNDINPLLQVG
jgi:hypothetical protein